ncbi:sugar transferase [Amylibacter sp.]|nr:sugar transferase [Amylibacter sp.]
MFKRFFDIVLSLTALFALSPIILIITILLIWKTGSPVFFRQSRTGLNGNTFEMIKFRTMNNKVDKNGDILPDNKRLNSFGILLRSTSLDEIPELWNVLKGDMSLVGPRPLLVEYLPLYSDEQARRHLMRPGITGWAQVNGRNSIDWQQKFKLDIWYIDNYSFWLDLKIIFITLKKVKNRDGISASNHVTMKAFTGNDNDR